MGYSNKLLEEVHNISIGYLSIAASLPASIDKLVKKFSVFLKGMDKHTISGDEADLIYDFLAVSDISSGFYNSLKKIPHFSSRRIRSERDDIFEKSNRSFRVFVEKEHELEKSIKKSLEKNPEDKKLTKNGEELRYLLDSFFEFALSLIQPYEKILALLDGFLRNFNEEPYSLNDYDLDALYDFYVVNELYWNVSNSLNSVSSTVSKGFNKKRNYVFSKMTHSFRNYYHLSQLLQQQLLQLANSQIVSRAQLPKMKKLNDNLKEQTETFGEYL